MSVVLHWVLLAAAGSAPQSSDSTPRPVSLTESAVQIATQAAAQRDPRAIVAAGEIIRMVERGSARVRRVGPAGGPEGPWGGRMTSTALLRLANRMASNQGDWATADYAAWLLQLPDTIPVTRGATGGPVWADAYLGPGKELSYTIEFAGGQTPNLLKVSGSKASVVLECELSEASAAARVAARARSLAGTCSMEWRQSSGGPMTLRIRNRGTAAYFVVSSN